MQPYLGDLKKTAVIGELLQVPKENRDQVWVQKFTDNISEASFRSGETKVIEGPDSFPYFALYLPEPNQGFQCFVISHMKDDFLLEQGLGVVIQPGENGAEWVFTYGDIVNYHLTGHFYSPEAPSEQKEDQNQSDFEQILIGQPAENFLPKAVRTILRRYLAPFNVTDPKILLMISKTSPANQELVFNLAPGMFGSQQVFDDVMKRIAWFLPRHYIYSSAWDNQSLEASFMPL